MTDLAVLALGFGVMPFAAILLYSFRDDIAARREVMWGFLAGAVAFLGLSHAMAVVLVNHSLFLDEATATFLSVLGLAVGGGLAWWLLVRSRVLTEPVRALLAAVVFVALHSFGDGLVLGRDFVGGLVPTLSVDGVTVSATVVHRFIEGALLVVPALAASWRPRSTFVLLSASLVSIPAAYVPSWIFDAYGFTPTRSVMVTAIPTFVAAAEGSFALILLMRAFLPAAVGPGTRWIAWTAIGFIAISAIHFLVE